MWNISQRNYNARWYDPALGRLCEASLWDAQADSIIPPGVQGLDRYAYVNNSPMNYTDPSGHICVESDGDSDAGMAGNCHGGSNPNYKGGLQGSPSGWAGHEEESEGDKVNLQPSTNSCTVSINSCELSMMKSWTLVSSFTGNTWVEVSNDDAWLYIKYREHSHYEGSLLPFIGLAVDATGITADAATVTSAWFPGVGPVLGSGAEALASGFEFSYNTFMASNGNYEEVYNRYHTNIMDARATQLNDSLEPVPLAGFTASAFSAYNNLQVINAGYVTTRETTFAITWNGRPPLIP